MSTKTVSKQLRTMEKESKEKTATRKTKTNSRIWAVSENSQKSLTKTINQKTKLMTNSLQESRPSQPPFLLFPKVRKGTPTRHPICTIGGRRSAAKGEWS